MSEEYRLLAIRVHDIIVEEMDSTKGTRYDADLERADNIGALACMVATIHPFVDANKRTAYVLWRLAKAAPLKDILDHDFILHAHVVRIIKKDKEWMEILSRI